MVINNGAKAILKTPKQTRVGRDREELLKATRSAETEESNDRVPCF